MGLKSWFLGKALEGKLPLWVYRLIGKVIGKKLGLKEDYMPDSTIVAPTKPWYLSKAIWAAVVTAILGAIQPISAALGHPIAVPLWVLEILTGLGLYGLRVASKPIG